MNKSQKPVTCIGSGAGFAGDRVDPAVALVKSGLIDSLGLECLAERTLVPAIKLRKENSKKGFDPRLRTRLTPLLPQAFQRNCRIISNLGAANPACAGEEIARLANELGFKKRRIAGMIGDDVMGLTQHIKWNKPITGQANLLGAHAYLGCKLMSKALEEGADVVVTGRVADSAIFAAPALARLDNEGDALAGALTVGHLLECGGQLTGGNYEPIAGSTKRPPLSAQEYACLGYPLAKIFADGHAQIGLAPDTPGIVDKLTCTLQLLYEVHNPTHYITPDLILDFSGVRFEQTGSNQIMMHGARSKGAPPTLKVAGFVEHPGFTVDIEIGYAGTGALMRAKFAADVLRRRVSLWPGMETQIDLVGVDSVLGKCSRDLRADPVEVRVHISAACEDTFAAQSVEDEVYALTLSGPAGGCSVRSERRARIEVLDGYIEPRWIQTELIWSES